MRLVNFDYFGDLKSVLKFHIFISLTCEESVRIRLICEELGIAEVLLYVFVQVVRFNSDVNNWYSIFTNVKNSYKFHTHVKNWYSVFTNVKNSYKFHTHVKNWYSVFTNVKNSYKFHIHVKNRYQIHICEELVPSAHTCQKLVPNYHRCDELVLKLHRCQ